MENARKTPLSGPSHHMCWHNLELISMVWKMLFFIFLLIHTPKQSMNLPLVLAVFWGVQPLHSLRDLCPTALQPRVGALCLGSCGGCTLSIELFNKPPSKVTAFSSKSQTLVPWEVQHGHCPLQTQDPETVTDPLSSKFMEFSIPSPPVSLRREQLVLFLVKRVPKIGIFIRNLYPSIQTKTFKNHDSQSPPKSWD